MKFLYRSLLLICLFLIIVSLKKDIMSEYNVATAAQSVCTGDLNQDGFNDIVRSSENKFFFFSLLIQ